MISFAMPGKQPIYTRQELEHKKVLRASLRRPAQAELAWSGPAFDRMLRQTVRDRLWQLLDDPRSGQLAWATSMALRIMVLFSLGVTSLQISEDAEYIDRTLAAVFESCIDSVFLLEYACRVISAPLKCAYFQDPYNWADMASATGLLLRASVGFVIDPEEQDYAVVQILLFILPLVRFLKWLRYFESFRLLVETVRNCLESLPVLLYTMGLIVLASSSCIYLAESRESIPTFWHSVWLAVVTMTTVGYGDFAPKSTYGYLTVSALTMVSVLFFALPVGVFGHEFTNCWCSRSGLLLRARAQKAFRRWGYTVEDVKMVFDFADADNQGALNLLEFTTMIREMNLGLNEDEALELFSMVDTAGSGLIECHQFLCTLFPDLFDPEAAAELSETIISPLTMTMMERSSEVGDVPSLIVEEVATDLTPPVNVPLA